MYNVHTLNIRGLKMLIEQLKKKDKFTETEALLADFILDHGEDLLHMSIRDLADACYTSPNAIMRMCRKTGCEGFRDFKVRFMKDLETSVYKDELLDVNRPFYIGQSTKKIAHTMLTLQHQAIRDLTETINYRNLEKAAALFTRAHVIFLYGHGDSMIRARSFMNKMFKINKLCILASEAHEENGMSYNASKDDAALFISYRGGNARFEACQDVLKKNNCPSVVLSADIPTNLNQNCDIWLSIPDRENSGDNIGTFYSQICFDYILNLIYCLIYSATYTKNHIHKSNIDSQTLKTK